MSRYRYNRSRAEIKPRFSLSRYAGTYQSNLLGPQHPDLPTIGTMLITRDHESPKRRKQCDHDRLQRRREFRREHAGRAKLSKNGLL